MENNHRKKMVAPIIITLIMIVYYGVYFGVLSHLIGGIWGVLLGIVPVLLGGTMIYVCIERINEIQKGEEDDLSNY